MLNPVPLALAAEIVRLDPPEFVSVSESVLEVPTVTLPKLRLEGFGEIWPGATPVPDKDTESVGFEAVELIVKVPELAPVAVGANTALKLVVWPAPRVMGNVGPVKLKPVPLALALETVTLEPPVFVIVTGVLWLVPVFTFPKLTLVGLAVSAPAV